MDFNYKKQDDEDFYKIIGCDQLSNSDQILTEYRKKVISCHPDKNPDDTDAKRRFELLKLAKETLTDEKLREKYNNWLNSGVCMSWKDWLNHSERHQMVFHWVYKKPDAMLEDAKTEQNETQSQCKDTTFKYWNTDQSTSNDLLKKFRNYQI